MDVTAPRNMLLDTQPDNDVQASCQEKHTRLSGEDLLLLATVSLSCHTGARMSVWVVVAAVAASDMREGLMPI